MKAMITNTNIFSNNIIRMALVTAMLLLVPLIAMQFTDEVNWTLFDFIIAGVLLFGTGLIYELLVKKVRNKNYRFYATIGLMLGLAWLWVELAVGLFTNWGS